MKFHVNPVAKDIIKNQQIIDWEKQRLCQLNEQIRTAREHYREYLQEKFNIRRVSRTSYKISTSKLNVAPYIDLATSDDSLENYTYEELLLQEKEALSKPAFVPDPRKSMQIAKQLQQKTRETAKRNMLKVQMQKILLSDLWNAILDRQQQMLEDNITRKLLKQSLYEKQMATKMFEVRDYKQRILDNRRYIDHEIAKSKEEEFMKKLFDKDADNKLCTYYTEKQRVLELHRRIYEEKLRLKKKRIHELCKETVNDLVDLALVNAEYKEKFNREPDRRKKQDWTSLFILGKSLFDIVEPVEDILEYVPGDCIPEETENIYIQEIDRQDALDTIHFEEYCNFWWPWSLEENEESVEEVEKNLKNGMNVLG